jgi:hypothetical protein
MALATGLLGSFGHCAAMCGPIAAAVGLSAGPGALAGAALRQQLLYNAGRIATYTAAGALMGFAGSVVNVAGRVAGLQQVVSILAGALMLAMGLSAAGLLPWGAHLEARLAGQVFGAVRGMVRGPLGGPGRTLVLGLALGLLQGAQARFGQIQQGIETGAGEGGAFGGALDLQ